jgi:hypothetical protein
MSFAAGTSLLLLAYLGWFTVLKFRRVAREKIEFKKMQKGAEIAKKLGKQLDGVNANIDKNFLQGKG